MNQTVVRVSNRKMLAVALLAALLLALFAGLGRANAEGSSVSATPASVAMGGSLMVNGSGFTPDERIVLWTTAPDGTALDASYIFADSAGNFTMQINSADPSGLATEGNYTTLKQTFDDDGNLLTSTWELTLKDNPAAGAWHVTAQGSSSTATQVYNFSLTAQ